MGGSVPIYKYCAEKLEGDGDQGRIDCLSSQPYNTEGKPTELYTTQVANVKGLRYEDPISVRA